jgi:hypothetical protein
MFDAEAEVLKLKQLKKTISKKRYSRSKLDKYSDELKSMKSAGATYADLQRWLQARRIKVVWSTVQRWFSNHG